MVSKLVVSTTSLVVYRQMGISMYDLTNPHHHFLLFFEQLLTIISKTKIQELFFIFLLIFFVNHGSVFVFESSEGGCGYVKRIRQTLSQEQEVDVLCLCIPSVSQWFSLVVQRLCHQTRHNKLDSRIKSDTYDGSKHP